MRRNGWTAPTALAVLVLALLGGVGWLAARGGDSPSTHRPALLHLSSGGGPAATIAGSPGGATGGAPYRLVGDLPAGQPDDQPVYRLRTATADDADAVASALGISATPVRVSGGWAVRDGGNRLVVRDEGDWSYGLDCTPDAPIADEDVSVACATASAGTTVGGTADGGTSTSPGNGSDPCNPETDDCVSDPPMTKPLPRPTIAPGPSESSARAAAAPVLARLGLADAAVTVWPGDPSATVQATPVLGGHSVVGWTVSLQIDGRGHVVGGDGWVTDPQPVDRYPVITAQHAFDLLGEQPRPMIELCARRPDGKPGCADVPPTDITGAHLGHLLDYDGTRAILVPAWLFDVKDQPEPLAQVAVDPAYLATPPTEQGSTEPGGVTTVGPSAGMPPGSLQGRPGG